MLQILIFHGHFTKILSEAPSHGLLAYSQLQESLLADGELMGGQSGDPRDPWEFCDCNSYCSSYGDCARAHLLTLWVPGTPDIRGWCPLLTAPPPSLLCSLIQKQQEAGSLCWTRSSNAQLDTLRPRIRSGHSWVIVGSGMFSGSWFSSPPPHPPRNVRANQVEWRVSYIPFFDLV